MKSNVFQRQFVMMVMLFVTERVTTPFLSKKNAWTNTIAAMKLLLMVMLIQYLMVFATNHTGDGVTITRTLQFQHVGLIPMNALAQTPTHGQKKVNVSQKTTAPMHLKHVQ